MQKTGIIGILILIADIYAILKIAESSATTGKKALWIAPGPRPARYRCDSLVPAGAETVSGATPCRRAGSAAETDLEVRQ